MLFPCIPLRLAACYSCLKQIGLTVEFNYWISFREGRIRCGTAIMSCCAERSPKLNHFLLVYSIGMASSLVMAEGETNICNNERDLHMG